MWLLVLEGLSHYFSVLPMDVKVDMLVSNIWAIEEARMVTEIRVLSNVS